MSGAKHLNLVGLDNQIGEFTFEAGSFDDVVIDPVVVTAAGFAEEAAMVFEAVSVEPFFGDGAVFFGARGKESNDMPFVVPFVDKIEGIRIGEAGAHSFRLLIGYVITDGTIDINQKIFDPGG